MSAIPPPRRKGPKRGREPGRGQDLMLAGKADTAKLLRVFQSSGQEGSGRITRRGKAPDPKTSLLGRGLPASGKIVPNPQGRCPPQTQRCVREVQTKEGLAVTRATKGGVGRIPHRGQLIPSARRALRSMGWPEGRPPWRRSSAWTASASSLRPAPVDCPKLPVS